MKLRDPTFSPDEEKLAIVVTPPNYSGVSAIWLTDVQGSFAESVPLDAFEHRKLPAFSPNGDKIAYFKERPLPFEGRNAPNPELQDAFFYSIFEYDFESRREARLTRDAFYAPTYLAYQDADTFLFSAAYTGVNVGNSVEHWRTPPGSVDAVVARFGAGTRFRRGAEPDKELTPVFFGIEALRNAALGAFAPPSTYALVDPVGNPAQHATIVLWDGASEITPLPLPDNRTPMQVALDRNARTIVAILPNGQDLTSGSVLSVFQRVEGIRSIQLTDFSDAPIHEICANEAGGDCGL